MGCTTSKSIAEPESKPIDPPVLIDDSLNTITVQPRVPQRQSIIQPHKSTTVPLNIQPIGTSVSGDHIYEIHNKSDQYHIIKTIDTTQPVRLITVAFSQDDEIIDLNHSNKQQNTDDIPEVHKNELKTIKSISSEQYTPIMIS